MKNIHDTGIRLGFQCTKCGMPVEIDCKKCYWCGEELISGGK